MPRSRLLIDTNLLLLLVIGGVDGGIHIKNSKRLGAYGVEDYYLVLEVMETYDEVCITHHIATEVSNLIDLDGEAARKAYILAGILFSAFTQIDTNLKNDVVSENFILFGLTDSVLLELSSGYTIFTNDTRLTPYLLSLFPDNVLPYELAKAFSA